MTADLSPYVPRLLVELAEGASGPVHRVMDGTLVFADLSGFTATSERLARAGGKAGAEDMTAILNDVFGELLRLAAERGGEMLKYGGDAVLLFFRGEVHAARAAAAARDMQRRLRQIGHVRTRFGRTRLRMSVGVHSGEVDFFVAGPHHELVVGGAAPSMTASMEAAADADEILLSPATAALLPASSRGERKADGFLLKRAPRAPHVPVVARPSGQDVSAFVPRSLLPALSAGLVQPGHRPVTVGFLYLELDEVLARDGGPATATHLHTALTLIDDVFDELGVTFMATDLTAGGVKVIAAAGLPVAQPDAEERMLRALHALVGGGLALPAHAGAQRGHAFAGTVGPPYRLTYTMIGDVINTAARLASRAEPGELLTLAPVVERSVAEFEIDELAPFVAKGKAEPLQPIRVGAPTGQRRTNGDVLPLVGRDAEMAVLRDGRDALVVGRGGRIEIVGEAGMGKSRLAEELIAQSHSLQVIRATFSALDGARPYGAIESLLQDLAGCATPHALRRRVSTRAPELKPWLPLLAVPLGLRVRSTPEVDRLSQQVIPAKIREVTTAFVQACLDRPTLVVVEDLHWADQPSTALLNAIGTITAQSPLLLVSTRRPGDAASAPSPGVVIEIEALETRAAEAMAGRLIGRPLLPARMQALLDRAGGNPLFLRELALSLALGDTGELPDRVETLIESRIDRLEPADRAVLRVAAVVGPDFTEGEVAAGLGSPVPDVVWDRLSAFVIPDDAGDALKFRHALMRDSAYAGLPYRQRRDMHRRIGLHIESCTDAAERVERLAIHFAAAGDDERTWRYGVASGDRARERFAYAEAAAAYERAVAVKQSVEAEERFRVWDSYAYCLQTSGDLSGALGVIGRAKRAGFANPDDRARFWLQEATCLLMLGRLDAASRAVNSGLRVLPSASTSPSAVRLRLQKSRISHGRGRYVASRRWALEAASLAEANDDMPGLAHALASQYDAEVDLRMQGRDQLAERARRIFEECGLSGDAAIVLNLVAIDRRKSGMFIEAAAAYAEAERHQRAAGLTLHAAVSAYNHAWLLVQQGRFTDAGPTVAAAAATFVAAGYVQGKLAADCLSGQIIGASGDLKGALVLLEIAAAEYRQSGLEKDAREVELVEAEIHLMMGATDLARTVAPDPQSLTDRTLGCRGIRLAAVMGAMEHAEPAAIRAALEAAIDEADTSDLRFDAAVGRLLRSTLFADHASERAEAQRMLDELGVIRVPLVDLVEREIASGRISVVT